MEEAYRVSGGRDTVVDAGPHNWFDSAFRYTRFLGFEFLYLIVLADKITVHDINGKGLFVKFLCEFCIVLSYFCF